jgi:hypothetical protein
MELPRTAVWSNCSQFTPTKMPESDVLLTPESGPGVMLIFPIKECVRSLRYRYSLPRSDRKWGDYLYCTGRGCERVWPDANGAARSRTQ